MIFSLLPIFLFIPLVELWLLLVVGRHIGVVPTIGLVLVTGILGVTLAKSQGFLLLVRIQERLAVGELPTADVWHGFFILVGGVLLLTPGILTDTLGLLLLIPRTRIWCQKWLAEKLQQGLQRGTIQFWYRRRF